MKTTHQPPTSNETHNKDEGEGRGITTLTARNCVFASDGDRFLIAWQRLAMSSSHSSGDLRLSLKVTAGMRESGSSTATIDACQICVEQGKTA